MSHMFNKALFGFALLFAGTVGALLYIGAANAQTLNPSIMQVVAPPAAAAGGGGTVTSISNADGTITLSPNPIVGTGTVSLALGHANTWAGVQTFTQSDLALLGSSTGKTTLNSGLSGAGNNTLTLPITASDTLAALGTVQTFSAVQSFNDGDLSINGLTSGATVVKASATGGGTATFFSGSDTIAGKTVANGGTNCSAASITCFNNITGLSAAGTTGTTTTNLVFSTSPTLTTPNIGAATGTSLSVSGSLTSTVATGTAPLVVSSTTNVANLNASSLGGATFPAPGAIGGTTPAAITGTTIAANTNFSSTGTTAPTLAAGTIGMCAACSPTISANGEGMVYESTTNGLILAGKGSTADAILANSAGTMAFEVLTGTTNVQTAGTLTMGNNIIMGGNNMTSTGNVIGTGASGFEALGANVASATVPTLDPNKASLTTGIGGLSGNVDIINAATTNMEFTSGGAFFKIITTGTNADFLCMASGGLAQIQTSACTISSRRFKENIQEFTDNALVKIDELPVYTFNLKKTEPENKDPNATLKQLGLLAEDVAKIIPLCAIYENDMKTPKSYRQECVIAYLVKGMQDQQKEILDLQEYNNNSYVMPVQGIR